MGHPNEPYNTYTNEWDICRDWDGSGIGHQPPKRKEPEPTLKPLPKGSGYSEMELREAKERNDAYGEFLDREYSPEAVERRKKDTANLARYKKAKAEYDDLNPIKKFFTKAPKYGEYMRGGK